jgi:hypothetical protein
MSTLPHITSNPTSETPSVSETAVGGQAGASIVPKDTAMNEGGQEDPRGSSAPAPAAPKNSLQSDGPGSAEAAADKFFELREKAQQESSN